MMMDPVLVEESTPIKLASRLEDLVKTLPQDAIHHDYMMALIIVVMTEVGFSITSSGWTAIDSGCKKKPRIIPWDWKSEETGNYTLKFQLDQVPDREFKIVSIPNGDTLIVNLVLPNDRKTVLSIALQTAKYVNVYSSDLAGRYLNTKEFSFRFKNSMTTPARCEILSEAGMPNSSLSGIPTEIKLRIIGMLDVHSVINISQTSKEFCQLSRELKIWKNLVERDFGFGRIPNENDFRDSYKILYAPRHRISDTVLPSDTFARAVCCPMEHRYPLYPSDGLGLELPYGYFV